VHLYSALRKTPLMPADRNCWGDVEVRSADDVQQSVDAAV